MLNEATIPNWESSNSLYRAREVLNHSVSAWVIIALIGQWFFALYVFILYAVPIVSGDLVRVNIAQPIMGYVQGDMFGNAALFLHVIPAAILSIGGIVQLLPIIRRRFPAVHRWNGRLFLTLGFLGAVSGLYLTWIRGARLSDVGAIGITLNGILIVVAVALAWHYARIKRFDIHMRWATHAFLLINGVWFFRLMLMTWFAANQGANGNTSLLDGPMDIFFSFACYGLPMIIAECIFWARRQKQAFKVWAVSVLMSMGALITLIGIVAAIFMMWIPTISLAL